MFRKDLLELLRHERRSVSSLARDLHLRKGDVEADLRHLIRSARAAGHDVIVETAVCRTCGFTFDPSRLTKPGKCPRCRGTRILEAQIAIVSAPEERG